MAGPTPEQFEASAGPDSMGEMGRWPTVKRRQRSTWETVGHLTRSEPPDQLRGNDHLPPAIPRETSQETDRAWPTAIAEAARPPPPMDTNRATWLLPKVGSGQPDSGHRRSTSTTCRERARSARPPTRMTGRRTVAGHFGFGWQISMSSVSAKSSPPDLPLTASVL